MPNRLHHIGPPPALAVEEAGEGDAVLFLHGMGGNRTNWAAQIRSMSDAYRAIALDFRGYGDSDDIEGTHRFQDFVDDVAKVVDAFALERVHLVGLSMGGLVAQAFYAAQPARVASLTLAATRPGSAPVFPGERQSDFVARRLAPLENGAGIAFVAERLAPTLVASGAGPDLVEAARDSLMRLRVNNYVKIVRARIEIEPFLDLGEIDAPVLVFAGSDDQVAPVDQMRAIAEQIPNSRFEMVDGSGHLINLERPGTFNGALRRFLDDVSTRSRQPGQARAGRGPNATRDQQP